MKNCAVLLLLIVVLGVAVQAQETALERLSEEFPPLMRAAEAGNVDEVRRLLKAGANVNEKLEDIGITALIVAVGRGHAEVAKVLLEAGADPNAAGGVAHVGFFTPLSMAIRHKNSKRLELIDILIAAGARLNPPSWFPESPLFVAVKEHDIEMIKELLKRGSDVNWKNGVGSTALVTAVAIADRKVEVVKLLLDAGADPNQPRLWVGDECVSLVEYLKEMPGIPKDKVQAEIRRLVVKAGGKKFSKKSHGQPCNK